MGIARLAVYLVGLVLVVAAAWVFLTQTDVGQQVPTSIALAVILLLVGIGIMASARSINDRREVRRVVHEGGPAGATTYVGPAYREPGYRDVDRVREYDAPLGGRREVVEERRYDD